MSRSVKKTPRKGFSSSTSEKEDKRLANRKIRRVTRVEVHKGVDEISKVKELSNVWSFDKDGKRYLKNPSRKDMRK